MKEDHLKMAREEASTWEILKDLSKEKQPMEVVVGNFLNRPAMTVKARAALLRAGAEADALWRQMNSGMLPRTAYRLYYAAVKDSKLGKIPVATAVQRRIDQELSKSKYVVMEPEPEPEPGSGPPPPNLEPNPAAPAPPARKRARNRPGGPVPEGPWKKIRSAMDEVVQDRFKGVDADVVQDFRVQFQVEIQRMILWIQSRAQVMRQTPSAASIADPRQRRDVLVWCKTLKMRAPKPGDPVDPEELKRKYRSFARSAHPDRNKGNEAQAHEKMSAYNGAYEGLCNYNQSLENES